MSNGIIETNFDLRLLIFSFAYSLRWSDIEFLRFFHNSGEIFDFGIGQE